MLGFLRTVGVSVLAAVVTVTAICGAAVAVLLIERAL